MTPKRAVIVVCAALLIGAGSLVTAQGEQGGSDHAAVYLLKASSRWAEQIDKALAKVAQPMQFFVPSRSKPEQYIANLCADANREFAVAESKELTGRLLVTMTPCVRVRRNVKVEVTRGDTLETLAVRNGLPRATATSYKVIPAQGQQPKAISPEALQVGDTVVFPEVPVWTNVVANPAVAGDRETMVRAIADAIRCKEKDPEACLANNGIELLNRASVPVKSAAPKGLELELARAAMRERELARRAATAERAFERSAAETLGRARAGTAAPGEQPRARYLYAPGTLQLSSLAPAAPAPPAVADPPPPPPGTVPVAPEQWPYDINLLAKILKQVGPSLTSKTVIGIADGGLADAMGGPLSADSYIATTELRSALQENRQEPNDEDDDTNEWVDDLRGAGVQRFPPLGVVGTGDVAFCNTTSPDFIGWPKQASHGAAVAAVASARRLRLLDQSIAAALPQLLFFRLVAEACNAKASFDVGEGDLAEAFDYLLANADIINISYKINRTQGDRFTDRVRTKLPTKNTLLFLPAGNGDVNDLDADGACPACLGNGDPRRGGTASERTIVVGAATRHLTRAGFSGYGERTVRLFAPGEPSDAIDLLGQSLPQTDAATSYASPYAALAAAIIRSFGIHNDYDDLRDRLEAVTWPLEDSLSNTTRNPVGVVDLVKAAAVRHHAVEVKELEADGTWVRRTYVGKLDKALHELTICKGDRFKEPSFHAIRLGDPDSNGRRVLRLFMRAVNRNTQRRDVTPFSNGCQSDGELPMTTIDGQSKVFPMSNVTLIQLPWY